MLVPVPSPLDVRRSVEAKRGLRLDQARFHDRLKNSTGLEPLKALVSEQVLGFDPVAFESDMELFDRVRAHLAGELSVGAETVRLVGSGATGFSLAPRNYPRAFHPQSDLDFAIVSPELFDSVWNILLTWGHPVRHRVPAGDKEWFGDRQSEVFWGWFQPEYLRYSTVVRPRVLSELRSMRHTWFRTFKELGIHFPGTTVSGREASARLYRSESHLIHYQANGLSKLRNSIRKERKR